MNLKRISMILVVFFVLFLSIGAISADDDVNNTDITESDNSQNQSVEPEEVVFGINPKIQTDADSDGVIAEKGKTNYFKVEVENENDKPLKNLKLNVKVFTKSKSKTYVIKTNSKGIAKLNTKKLSLGDHKVIVTSANSKYDVYKKSSIVIGKKYIKATMKVNTVKKLSNKDRIKIYSKSDGDEIEIKMKIIKGGSVAKTKIAKAKFYFKKKSTGKIIVDTEYAEFEHGKWQWPDKDYSPKLYKPVKVKVFYISS